MVAKVTSPGRVTFFIPDGAEIQSYAKEVKSLSPKLRSMLDDLCVFGTKGGFILQDISNRFVQELGSVSVTKKEGVVFNGSNPDRWQSLGITFENKPPAAVFIDKTRIEPRTEEEMRQELLVQKEKR